MPEVTKTTPVKTWDSESSKLLGNPIGLAILLPGLRVLAKVVKQSGALDFLRRQAQATESKVDDMLLRVAEMVLDALAGD